MISIDECDDGFDSCGYFGSGFYLRSETFWFWRSEGSIDYVYCIVLTIPQ